MLPPKYTVGSSLRIENEITTPVAYGCRALAPDILAIWTSERLTRNPADGIGDYNLWRDEFGEQLTGSEFDPATNATSTMTLGDLCPTEAVALPGDYNRDLVVNAAGFIVWQNGLSATTGDPTSTPAGNGVDLDDDADIDYGDLREIIIDL